MHDFKSLQIDDEDSSIYFINYISDDSDTPESHHENDSSNPHSPEENLETDLSSIPNSLIITPVPQELFTNQQLKDEFEQLFRRYDPDITVLYLKFFQRVRITFTTSSQALKARLNVHEHLFHGTMIRTYFACPIIFRGANPETYLRPPEPDKLFLISPPVSPPVGWCPKLEDPPVVDLNLISAIAQLQPNQAHELLPRESGSKAPAIIIHTCDDIAEENHHLQQQQQQNPREKLVKPTILQTKRPPQIEGELV